MYPNAGQSSPSKFSTSFVPICRPLILFKNHFTTTLQSHQDRILGCCLAICGHPSRLFLLASRDTGLFTTTLKPIKVIQSVSFPLSPSTPEHPRSNDVCSLCRVASRVAWPTQSNECGSVAYNSNIFSKFHFLA